MAKIYLKTGEEESENKVQGKAKEVEEALPTKVERSVITKNS